ncbi:MAG TPA: RNA polymerase sigma factor [Planctomycetota bacterium]|nr:RNA polymerase sigma factor [Planctomycetota bacterium]
MDIRPQQVESISGSSLTELVQNYFMDVYGMCFRVLGRPQDAEDATQETFLALFRTREKLAAAQSLRAWVLTIARNTSISMLRARRPAASLPDSVADAPPIRSPGDPERLDRAMAALSEEDRSLVQMRFMEGRSPAEMALACGRSAGSVATALCRALKRLRDVYHGEAR